MGKVFISPNLKRTSERLDAAGNVINPQTKQVIANKEPEYTPPPVPITPPEAPVCPVAVVNTKDDGLSVLDQIAQTKKRLAELEELKKLKIAEKEAELQILKQ